MIKTMMPMPPATPSEMKIALFLLFDGLLPATALSCIGPTMMSAESEEFVIVGVGEGDGSVEELEPICGVREWRCEDGA